MNPLLKHYLTDVEFSGVSGAEHLEMLLLRDRLWEIESTLSEQERKTLTEADQQLIRQARVFYEELSQFIDLAAKRTEQETSSSQWWWYLDVLAQLPTHDLRTAS